MVIKPALDNRKFLVCFDRRLLKDLEKFLQLCFIVVSRHGLAGHHELVLVCLVVQRPHHVLETHQVDLLVQDPLHVFEIDFFRNRRVDLGLVGLAMEGLSDALLVGLLRQFLVHLRKSLLDRLREACELPRRRWPPAQLCQRLNLMVSFVYFSLELLHLIL